MKHPLEAPGSAGSTNILSGAGSPIMDDADAARADFAAEVARLRNGSLEMVEALTRAAAEKERLKAENAELRSALWQVGDLLNKCVQHSDRHAPLDCDLLRGDAAAARRAIHAALGKAAR